MSRLITLIVDEYAVSGYKLGATILATEEEAYYAIHSGIATNAGNASTW